MTQPTFIGNRVERVEDRALIRGGGRFIDDLHLPATREVAFVRSPIPHGMIRRIDVSAALALDGVDAVYSLEDLKPYLTSDRLPLQWPSSVLPKDIGPYVLGAIGKEVCYVGEAVALVIASSRYVAEDAVALVEVEFEDLPASSDCRAALSPTAPRVHLGRPDNLLTAFAQHYGDPRAALASAPHRVSLSLKQHRGGAHPIECRGVVAHYESFHEQITLWTSTQGPHEVRNMVVRMLGMDENHVRVITPDVGGGFGGKYVVYPEEIALAAASRKFEGTLKWIEDRREHFVAAIQERDQYWDLEVGFTAEGILLGVVGQMIHDAGAYTLQGINLPYNSSVAFPGPYKLPSYHLDVRVAETNKVATAPVRAAGYPEGAFAMERVMDAMADHLGISRVEVRRRNLVSSAEMPYELPLRVRSESSIIYDSGDFPHCLQLALDAIDYAGFEGRRMRAREEGRWIGLGVGVGLKGSGRGPFETATVRIGRSGKVSIQTGAVAMGQGLCTALAQICSEQLAIPPSDISIVAGDTAAVPLGFGGFASRQTVTAGNSVHAAAVRVRKKAFRIASLLLNAAEEDLEIGDGQIFIRGQDGRAVSFADLAVAAGGAPGYSLLRNIDPGLEATENFSPTRLTYSLGVHAVEAEVDIHTGGVRLTRYVVVTDCGRAINPMLVEGQILGGVVHGIGNALFEFMGYDESAQPFTTILADYLLPTAPEIPPIEVLLTEYPSPLNPLGVKGVGEIGTVPVAPAIISAVEDALRDIRITVNEVPLVPTKLWELIRNSSSTPRHSYKSLAQVSLNLVGS